MPKKNTTEDTYANEDNINPEDFKNILSELEKVKFSSENFTDKKEGTDLKSDDAEEQSRGMRLSNDETESRNEIRKDVVFLAKLVLGFMAFILFLSIAGFLIGKICYAIDFSDEVSLFIVAIATSATSITAITIALLVGAFRNPKGSDSENVGKGVAEGLATLLSLIGKGGV